MDLQSANAFLNELEDDFDVWALQYRDMRYWPMLRLYLWRLLIADISSKAAPVQIAVTKPAPKIVKPAAPPERHSPEALRQKVRYAFPEIVETDVLLLSRLEDSVDKIGDQLHDRLIDPLYRQLTKMDIQVEKLNFSRTSNPDVRNLAIKAPFFSPDGYGNIECEMPDVSELSGMFERANEHGLNIVPNDPVIRSLLMRTYQRATVFGALLDAYKPKLVMMAVYYDAFQMAAAQACRARGVRVVDIQHGKQGRHHGAYTDWKNMPASGSEFLPDDFWVWGKQTIQRIQTGMGAGATVHKPVLGGNVWVQEWRQGVHQLSADDTEFLQDQNKYSKRVLVSVQPISEPLNDTLLEALKNSPDDWVWWFRLHNKQRRQKTLIENLVKDTGANIEIDGPSRLPLYPLIQHASHHVTAWSTVAFEAEAFGCKTSLFHPQGRVILAKELLERRFQYADNAKRLLHQIEVGENKWYQRFQRLVRLDWLPVQPYILADQTVSEAAIRKLLSSKN